MDTPLISGFITRKQASERCKRAERTLQRYWSRAIETSDAAILKHLKLRTEDGDVIDGKDVTKKRIDDLKKQGRNPTWFVHATWVERKYGPRLEEKSNSKKADASVQSRIEQDEQQDKPSRTQGDVVEILKQQIADLKTDKEKLERDRQQDKQHHREDFKMLKEMFDTLKEDHEGTKKLLGKALDLNTEKLRQGEPEPSSAPPRAHSETKKPASTENVVEVIDPPSSFFDRHLPTFSRPFRTK